MVRSLVSRSTAATRTPASGRASVSSGPAAPVITSGPTVVSVTQDSITISWTLDQYATGYYEYGTTAGYGSGNTPGETSFDYQTHVQTITGLAAGTLYHIKVHSANAAAQTVASGDTTGTTTATPVPTGDYPPDQTGLTYVSPPAAGSVPSYLGTYTDGVSGLQVTRITNIQNARVRNPTNGAFTADGAYIMLCDSPAPILLHNNATFDVVTNPWSTYGYYPGITPANAGIMWMAWSGDNIIARRDFSGGYTLVKTFSEYSEILIDTHTCQSWDDRYWPISGKSGTTWYDFVWDREGDTKSAAVIVGTAGPQGGPDRIQMSASGTYAVIMRNASGLQFADVYDRATMTLQRTLNPSGTGSFPHNDMGYDTNGADVLVSVLNAGVGSSTPTMWRLSDGHRTHLLPGSGNQNAFRVSAHISTKCVDMEGPLAGGWAFLAESSNQDSAATPPGYGQIVAIKLTPGAVSGDTVTSTCKVYGYCYPTADYASEEVKATPNRDGTRVVFAGQKGQGTGTASYVYLVEKV